MVQQNLDIENTGYTGPVHYFASCALGWATAETRDEAIRKLVHSFRGEFSQMVKGSLKAGIPGAYLWSCEVQCDVSENYEIEFYKPSTVEIAKGVHHYVTYCTAKQVSYCSTLKANSFATNDGSDC